jgi:hypothetical protein
MFFFSFFLLINFERWEFRGQSYYLLGNGNKFCPIIVSLCVCFNLIDNFLLC